ncbi:TPA: hypothetical protein NHU72_001730 [Klebsiella oxytoca]|nr:hypothetical protein [Klebsiella oxytoca]
MTEIKFTHDSGYIVCTYTDNNNRVFNFSVITSNYNSEDEAKKTALNLALMASETYQEQK